MQELIEEKSITTDLILQAVCDQYHIAQEQISSRSRKREISDARRIAARLIKNNFPLYTLKGIGNLFGGRHHSSVLYWFDTFDELIGSDKDFTLNFDAINEQIKLV